MEKSLACDGILPRVISGIEIPSLRNVKRALSSSSGSLQSLVAAPVALYARKTKDELAPSGGMLNEGERKRQWASRVLKHPKHEKASPFAPFAPLTRSPSLSSPRSSV